MKKAGKMVKYICWDKSTVSTIQDSERLPHSSGSLSDDSNGRGLSRTEESTLTPKPDDEVLLQGGNITGSILQQNLENNSLQCKLIHSNVVPFTFRVTRGLVP